LLTRPAPILNFPICGAYLKLYNRIVLDTKYILIGGSGTIGSALMNGLGQVDKIIPPSRVREWGHKGLNEEVIRREIAADPLMRNVVIYTLGNTNPKTEFSELNWVNFELPRYILNILEDFESLFVTFGSVLEPLAIYGENRYLSSKEKYLNFVASKEKSSYLHFQLNTIYGGLVNHSHMLIGQLQAAIENKTDLHLSTGNQIRQYHHIDDLNILLVKQIQSGEMCGIQQLNHGDSITIRDMAEGVMDKFGLQHLLRFGSRPDPKEDNYSVKLEKTVLDEELDFRDTISGIYDYLNQRVRRQF